MPDSQQAAAPAMETARSLLVLDYAGEEFDHHLPLLGCINLSQLHVVLVTLHDPNVALATAYTESMIELGVASWEHWSFRQPPARPAALVLRYLGLLESLRPAYVYGSWANTALEQAVSRIRPDASNGDTTLLTTHYKEGFTAHPIVVQVDREDYTRLLGLYRQVYHPEHTASSVRVYDQH